MDTRRSQRFKRDELEDELKRPRNIGMANLVIKKWKEKQGKNMINWHVWYTSLSFARVVFKNEIRWESGLLGLVSNDPEMTRAIK